MHMTNPLRRLVDARVGCKPKYKFHIRCGKVLKRDEFLTHEECKKCIDAATRYEKFYNNTTMASEKNSGSISFCGREIRDVSQKLDDYVKETYGMTSCADSHVNVYRPNEQFKYHYDALNDKQLEAFGPQRIATALVYLNTLDDGGETVFPTLKESIAPVEGKLLFWENVDGDGNIDFDMGHLSNMSPEYKYVLVKMFHHII